MEKHGSNAEDIREFDHYDTFRGKVKLMVIMLKAFLGDYPLQGVRKNEIAKNAVDVAKFCEDWNQYSKQVTPTSRSIEGLGLDHILYQRINLLSTMVKSAVLGNHMGQFREKVIRDNINYIADALQFNPASSNPSCGNYRPRLVE